MHPQDIPRHLVYEAAWAAGRGVPRLLAALTGRYRLRVNTGRSDTGCYVRTQGYRVLYSSVDHCLWGIKLCVDNLGMGQSGFRFTFILIFDNRDLYDI